MRAASPEPSALRHASIASASTRPRAAKARRARQAMSGFSLLAKSRTVASYSSPPRAANSAMNARVYERHASESSVSRDRRIVVARTWSWTSARACPGRNEEIASATNSRSRSRIAGSVSDGTALRTATTKRRGSSRPSRTAFQSDAQITARVIGASMVPT